MQGFLPHVHLRASHKGRSCGCFIISQSTPISFWFLASIIFIVIVIFTKIGINLPACVVNEILNSYQKTWFGSWFFHLISLEDLGESVNHASLNLFVYKWTRENNHLLELWGTNGKIQLTQIVYQYIKPYLLELNSNRIYEFWGKSKIFYFSPPVETFLLKNQMNTLQILYVNQKEM